MNTALRSLCTLGMVLAASACAEERPDRTGLPRTVARVLDTHQTPSVEEEALIRRIRGAQAAGVQSEKALILWTKQSINALSRARDMASNATERPTTEVVEALADALLSGMHEGDANYVLRNVPQARWVSVLDTASGYLIDGQTSAIAVALAMTAEAR